MSKNRAPGEDRSISYIRPVNESDERRAKLQPFAAEMAKTTEDWQKTHEREQDKITQEFNQEITWEKESQGLSVDNLAKKAESLFNELQKKFRGGKWDKNDIQYKKWRYITGRVSELSKAQTALEEAESKNVDPEPNAVTPLAMHKAGKISWLRKTAGVIGFLFGLGGGQTKTEATPIPPAPAGTSSRDIVQPVHTLYQEAKKQSASRDELRKARTGELSGPETVEKQQAEDVLKTLRAATAKIVPGAMEKQAKVDKFVEGTERLASELPPPLGDKKDDTPTTPLRPTVQTKRPESGRGGKLADVVKQTLGGIADQSPAARARLEATRKAIAQAEPESNNPEDLTKPRLGREDRDETSTDSSGEGKKAVATKRTGNRSHDKERGMDIIIADREGKDDSYSGSEEYQKLFSRLDSFITGKENSQTLGDFLEVLKKQPPKPLDISRAFEAMTPEERAAFKKWQKTFRESLPEGYKKIFADLNDSGTPSEQLTKFLEILRELEPNTPEDVKQAMKEAWNKLPNKDKNTVKKSDREKVSWLLEK